MNEDGTAELERLVRSWHENQDLELTFKRIFEHYHSAVFYFFTNRRCTYEESLDLTQETFIGIYRGLASFRGEASFETWLFGVARNVWRNQVRTRATKKRTSREVSFEELRREDASDVTDSARSPEPGPLDDFLDDERADLLRQALDELPAQMRSCLLFRLDHGLKYQEIATIMEISTDTTEIPCIS